MHYSQITERIYVGAMIHAAGLDVLRHKMGITHILNCMAEYDDTQIFKHYPYLWCYLWAKAEDDGQSKPPKWYDDGIDFCLGALQGPGNKIYIHCAAGVNEKSVNVLCCNAGNGLLQGRSLLSDKRSSARGGYRL